MANYVDNRRLFHEIVAHLDVRRAYLKQLAEYERREASRAFRRGRDQKFKTRMPRAIPKPEKPRIPEYVGECLLLIATRVSMKPNFVGYPFREEMVSDAVENSIRYLHNFNPEKSQNPFAYFTQITIRAFLRRIGIEKQYSYIKTKVALEQIHQGVDHATMMGESYELRDPSWAGYENVQEFVRDYEEKMQLSRVKPVRERVVVEDEENPTFDFLDDENLEEGTEFLVPEADGRLPDDEPVSDEE